MTGSAPQISILMTVFNTASFLSEAIDSILAQQTHRTWELILVDDGSDDGSLKIARRYASQHPQCISVYSHPGGVNRGISASRNLALTHARGTLLTFLDSDDVWLPHHLETQASLLDEHPHVTMVYAAAERWVDHAQPFDEAVARAATWGSNYLPPLVPTSGSMGLLAKGALLQWFLHDEGMVPCICTVMVRTAAARAVGGFCDDFRGLYDDQVFHAKLSAQYSIFANDVCTARYRMHVDSCCARSHAQTEFAAQERLRFLDFLQVSALRT